MIYLNYLREVQNYKTDYWWYLGI